MNTLFSGRFKITKMVILAYLAIIALSRNSQAFYESIEPFRWWIIMFMIILIVIDVLSKPQQPDNLENSNQ